MTDNDDFERDRLAQQLRDSLAAHAAQAPNGDLLAERIIHAADRESVAARRTAPRGWRVRALPLVAAAAVAAVVLTVVGIEHYQPTSTTPGASDSGSVTQTSAPAPTDTGSPVPTTLGTTAPAVGELTNVKLLDLTFASENEGWALAAADCLSGPGRCTALLHTTDGTSWTSMAGARFNVPGVTGGCGYPCVTDIRFADPDVGYAFGPHAFLMTKDGGASWTRESGGALFVETLDHNVIRVTGDPSGCPGPCNVQVETAAIGSTTWTSGELGPLSGAALSFSRGGSDAYLLVERNPAAGANDATSTLYRSGDDGRSWTTVGEPCPQLSGEVDSFAVAGAPYGRVSVLCVVRSAAQRSFVATSTDHGANFTAQPGTIPISVPDQLTGDPTTVLVVARDGLARSTDGGRSWTAVPDVQGRVTFVGFESPTVGRAVTDQHTIWTTRDGGRTWRPKALG
jgi:photosystem II stability/assembly factor-like uncharacterized protein